MDATSGISCLSTDGDAHQIDVLVILVAMMTQVTEGEAIQILDVANPKIVTQEDTTMKKKVNMTALKS